MSSYTPLLKETSSFNYQTLHAPPSPNQQSQSSLMGFAKKIGGFFTGASGAASQIEASAPMNGALHQVSSLTPLSEDEVKALKVLKEKMRASENAMQSSMTSHLSHEDFLAKIKSEKNQKKIAALEAQHEILVNQNRILKEKVINPEL